MQNDAEPTVTPPSEEPLNPPAEQPVEQAADTTFQPFTSNASDSTPVAAPAEVAPSLPTPPVKKKKIGLIVGIVIAAALVVLGGGSALAYNVWYQNPDKVIGDALASAITAETIASAGTFSVEKEGEYSLDVTLDFKAGHGNGELAAKVNYKADGNTYALDGAGRFTKEGDLYVKINNVRDLAKGLLSQGDGEIDLSAFDTLIKKFDNTWIKFSSEELGDFGEDYKKASKCYEELSNSMATDRTWASEIGDLYKKHAFIIVGDSLGSKSIKGVDSIGYKVTGDADKGKLFFTGLKDTQVGKKLVECNDTIDFESYADDITKSENDTKSEFQVWASRFGHTLTELHIKGEDEGVKASVTLNPIFDAPVTVEVPEKTMSFDDIKKDFQDAYMELYMQQYNKALEGSGSV